MSEPAASPAAKLPPRATHVAHAWLSAEEYRMLELEAARRRLLPDQLAAKILSVVLWHDDVGLLLDR